MRKLFNFLHVCLNVKIALKNKSGAPEGIVAGFKFTGPWLILGRLE